MKTAERWEVIFKGENVPQQLNKQGYAIISSRKMRETYNARPRLLGKMDSADDLPEIFRQHDAAVLSLTNRTYIIMKLGDQGRPLFPHLHGVKDVPRHVSVAALQRHITTIPWDRHFGSESQAMDAAVAAGILQDFVGDDHFVLTIRGRQRLGLKIPLCFRVKNKEITFPEKVSGIQMEVDGGYEGNRGVYLVEAKNRIQTTFNLRQVYFPYVHWSDYLKARNVQKPVHSVFMLYTAHQYFLYELEIKNAKVLNDIQVRRMGWYVLGDPPVSLVTLGDIINQSAPQPVPDIPFPQADTLLRVFSVLENIQNSANGGRSAHELAEVHEITTRQGRYYASAARWLGWLFPRNGQFVLTQEGEELLNLSRKDVSEWAYLVFETLASRPVFRPALAWWVEHGRLPDQTLIQRWIVQAVKQGEIKPLGGATLPRRAQTVCSWLKILSAWVQ